MRLFFSTAIFIFSFPILFAQRNAAIDSVLNQPKSYSKIVYGLNALHLSEKQFEKAFNTEKNDKIRLKFINVLCFKNFISDPQKALEYAKMQLELAEKINDKDAIEMGYDSFGFLYRNFGEYEKSLSYLLKSLKIKEERRDSVGISQTMNGIGALYFTVENFPKALEYMLKTLLLDSLIGRKNNIAIGCGNIGVCYANMNRYDKALQYYMEAERVGKELGRKPLSSNLLNTGIAFKEIANLGKAEEYLLKALDISEEDADIDAIISANTYLGDLYSQKKEYALAIRYAEKGLSLAKENKLISSEIEATKILSGIYSKSGNYKKAFDYHLQFSNLKDTLLTSENSRAITEMNTKYETEKKEKQIEIQKLTLTQQDLELNKKQIIIYSTAGGIGLLVLLSFFIFRGYRQKKQANIELTDKNLIIAEKSKIVEEQHKDITDSIKYAERIQKAILPPKKFWNELLPNSFVLYKPKDILSGDFYFIEQNDEYVYVAAADCTGHGVPGALMSLVNYNLLNKAVLEKNLVQPSEILDEVNKSLTVSLHQTYNESAVRDGMDIALCAIRKKNISPSGGGVRPGRTGEVEVQFAGAFNGGYIFKKDGSFTDLNGDKKPVGAFIEEKISLFTNFSQVLEEGDKVFIFSDGYADQFGGPSGKKLKYKKLQQYIAESLHLEMKDQRKFLEQKFNEWKGRYEQVDDVLVIGFCI